MGSRGETVVKLRMTPYFWRLLGKYCVVLSCQTMARSGRRMSITNTVTGIIASHLGRHAQWIEDEFGKIIKEVALSQASGYPIDYVDAVASSSPTQISSVVRAGVSPKRLSLLLKGVRPLLHIGRPTRSHAGRPAKGPGEVRDGGLGATAIPSVGGSNPQWAEPRGDESPGSGDLGPQPELLKKAVRQFGKFLESKEGEAIIQKLGRQAPQK